MANLDNRLNLSFSQEYSPGDHDPISGHTIFDVNREGGITLRKAWPGGTLSPQAVEQFDKLANRGDIAGFYNYQASFVSHKASDDEYNSPSAYGNIAYEYNNGKLTVNDYLTIASNAYTSILSFGKFDFWGEGPLAQKIAYDLMKKDQEIIDLTGTLPTTDQIIAFHGEVFAENGLEGQWIGSGLLGGFVEWQMKRRGGEPSDNQDKTKKGTLDDLTISRNAYETDYRNTGNNPGNLNAPGYNATTPASSSGGGNISRNPYDTAYNTSGSGQKSTQAKDDWSGVGRDAADNPANSVTGAAKSGQSKGSDKNTPLGETSVKYGNFYKSSNNQSSGSDKDNSQQSNSSRNHGYQTSGYMMPIIIDMNGDGIHVKTLDQSTTHFDGDDDVYKEKTAWTAGDDAFLIYDLNNDGKVTESKEMAFAKWTEAEDTDLGGLAAVFDSNHDGYLDERDEGWNQFKVWQDRNGDGVVDDGEMMTLAEAGITSIGLSTR